MTKIRNTWKVIKTSGQNWAAQVKRIEGQIAQAQIEIAFMTEQGLDLTSMHKLVARLQKKLDALNAE